MRTLTVFLPQSISLSAATTLRRARGLSSGATESSRSRNTTSALERLALSIIFGLDAGTASSERCRRGITGSNEVRLITGFQDSRRVQLKCNAAIRTHGAFLFNRLSRRALERPDQHRKISAAFARPHQRVELLFDDCAGGQRQAGFLCEFEHD